MVLKSDKEKLQALIAETLTLMCKNGLAYKSECSVEALVGITLDQQDVVLININQLLHVQGDTDTTVVSQSVTETPKPALLTQATRRGKRKRKAQRKWSSDDGWTSDCDYSSGDCSDEPAVKIMTTGVTSDGKGFPIEISRERPQEHAPRVTSPVEDDAPCLYVSQFSEDVVGVVMTCSSEPATIDDNMDYVRVKPADDRMDCERVQPEVHREDMEASSESAAYELVRAMPRVKVEGWDPEGAQDLDTSTGPDPTNTAHSEALVTTQTPTQQTDQQPGKKPVRSRTSRGETKSPATSKRNSVDTAVTRSPRSPASRGSTANQKKDASLPCDICGKTVTATNMRRHLNLHQGIYLYNCKVCTKGFTTRSAVDGHMVTHTGVKQHECPVCQMQFAHKQTLVQHNKRVHSINWTD